MSSDERNSQDGDGNEEPTKGSATDAADPERRELIEPDREGAQGMSRSEQDARSRIHSDRDPEDDIRLAASDPRAVDGEGSDEDG